MSFGEWLGTVLAVIAGAIGVAAMGAFVFIMALRWPIAIIICAYLLAKTL
jgi:hypothetical protein